MWFSVFANSSLIHLLQKIYTFNVLGQNELLILMKLSIINLHEIIQLWEITFKWIQEVYCLFFLVNLVSRVLLIKCMRCCEFNSFSQISKLYSKYIFHEKIEIVTLILICSSDIYQVLFLQFLQYIFISRVLWLIMISHFLHILK